MKIKNWIFPFMACLAMILFSQTSYAIIINSYTALYEDGSKLVVDLKGYDYGRGSYYAAPFDVNETGFPPVEGFDTFLYPSTDTRLSSVERPGIPLSGDGLNFMVDEFGGVSMTDFYYASSIPDYTISDYSLRVYYTELLSNLVYDHQAAFLSDWSSTSIPS